MAFRRIFSLLACLLCASAAHAEQMRSGGQLRTWTAQLPAGAHALPLVLVLHGNTQVTRIDSRCPRGGQVLLYRVDGGGHRMPDAMADAHHPRLVDALLGVQNHDIAAPELIWRYFASQPAR